MKTLDPKSPGPAASLVETEESPKTEEDPDASEPEDEWDIQMQYSTDQLCNQNLGAVTKNYL